MINNLKEKQINCILEEKEITEKCEWIKAFGSVIREDCREDSDIDLFIKLKEPTEENANEVFITLSLMYDSIGEVDVFFEHEQSGKANPMLLENMNRGLKIYECTTK